MMPKLYDYIMAVELSFTDTSEQQPIVPLLP